MAKVSASVYLVLEPEHNYRGEVTGLRIDRALMTKPKLSAKHVAMKVNIEIDAGVFQQFTPEATITVQDGRALITPIVGVEAPPDEVAEPAA